MIHRVLALLPFLALGTAMPAGAASATLVADIDPGVSVPDLGDDRGPSSTMVRLGDRVLFVADEPGTGRELWVTDGTPTGTRILLDACPGPCNGELSVLGASEEVAFYAYRQTFSSDLQKVLRTDGTPAGTFVIDLRIERSSFRGPTAAVAGAKLFVSNCDAFGREPCRLLVSDGAGAETILELADARALGSMMPAGRRLFFVVGFSTPLELWVTDGTAAGTRLVRQIPGSPRAESRLLAVAGSRIFFILGGDGGDGQLWTSDGTAAGTLALTSFVAPRPFAPTTHLRAIDGAVYFVADDVVGGTDLWVSDGTGAGTRRVTDFGFAHPFGGAMVASQLEKVGGRLVFVASDGLTGQRLWTSGGTPATTVPLTGCPGSSCPAVEGPLAKVGGRVLFAGADAARGLELWASDGTGGGTARLRDLCPGACDSQPAVTTALGAVWVAARTADFNGNVALLRSDGTPAGTREVARLSPEGFNHISGGSFRDLSGFRPQPVGERLAFVAWDPEHGAQLWTSDGTPAGTGPATLIAAGGRSSAPRSFARLGQEALFFACRLEEDDFLRLGLWASGGSGARRLPWNGSCRETPLVAQAGGLLFFAEQEGASVWRLWRTDGTDAGTVLLATLPGALYLELAAIGTRAVVLAADNDRAEVWASDGTPQGTARVSQMPPGVRKPLRPSLTGLGAQAYFVTTDPRHDAQVWVTDGTPGGTLQLTTLDDHLAPDDPEFTRLGSTVYFLVNTGFGEELWATDGTPAGTRVALPLASGGLSPWNLMTLRGGLLFNASTDFETSPGGVALWRLDGASATLVAPIGPVTGTTERRRIPWAVLGDRLFFVADEGEHGRELWSTDGTPAGTRLVRDVSPGPLSSDPEEMVVAGGRLYLVAGEPGHGIELWESDGTAFGTRLLQDVAPGGLSSQPGGLTVAGDRLFFAADDGVLGREPWALPLTAGAPACQPTDTALCLNGGRFRVEATWRDFQGRAGRGHARALTADTGYFWFFDDDNVEVILKMLDGRGVNDHFWAFYGALSNVEYTLTVTDTATGASRRYVNPPGRFGSVGDTDAFGPRGAHAGSASVGPAAEAEPAVLVGERRTKAAGPCVPGPRRLCLNGGRFAIEARWRDFGGNQGEGTAVSLTADTGWFWFFDDDNVEAVVKVLDGRPVNGRFWLFYGALSNVEYTLTVTDTATGVERTYTNPRGRFASVGDTNAF